MLSKSVRCTENCKACSWHWSTERVQSYFMTVPNLMLHNHASIVERIGLQTFASSTIFTWPLANDLSLLQASQQLFAGKMLPQPTGGGKCFPKFHLILKHGFLCYQFSSVQWLSHVRLCDPMNHSTPDLPAHHHLPEFTQTHVHRVTDAIQPSHPLSSPSPPAPNPSHIRVFSNESTLHMRWPKYWSFSFSIIPSREHPGMISFRMDWLD